VDISAGWHFVASIGELRQPAVYLGVRHLGCESLACKKDSPGVGVVSEKKCIYGLRIGV
jgi:hypothetical protein